MRGNANSIEAEKGQILQLVGEHGEGAMGELSNAYQKNPVVKKAILDMVMETVGSYMRQMLLRVIAEGGAREDAEYLGLLLHSGHLPKFSYSFKERFEFEGNFLHADKDENVRMAAVRAIENIFSRESKNGGGFIGSSLGKALVNSAMLDPSDSVRQLAAIAIAKHGNRLTLTELCLKVRDAEHMKKEGLVARGAEAVKTICWAMKNVRVRGTALYGLTDLALSGGRAGKLGQDAIVILGKKDSEVVRWLNKEHLKILQCHDGETPEEEKARRGAVLNSIVEQIGPVPSKNGRRARKKMTVEEEIKPEELMPPPKQMRGNSEPENSSQERGIKPTRPMRPVESKRKPRRRRAIVEDDEPIIVRGPAVELVMRAGRAIRNLVRDPRK